MMQLPFRRRHHDDDSSHDRARSLLSERLDGPLGEAEEAWLGDHLARCPECTADEQAYLADQALLHALRARPLVPPRDLWARTSAAIEREAGRAPVGRPASREPLRGIAEQVARTSAGRRLPLGILSGALVAALVLAVALLPPGGSITPGFTPGNTFVARATPLTGPTPLPIADAKRVGWIEQTDGGYAIVFAPVEQACPASDPTCAALAGGSPAPIQGLAAPPQAVIQSPHNDQVAVVGGADTSDGVIIVSIPTPRPTQPGSTATATSAAPASTPASPAASASGSQPTETPGAEAHAIIRDVEVIGEATYSADGSWLAFSARPVSGSGGPYLYVWHVGDAAARQLTTDGMTYVAGWYGNQVVVSQVALPASASGTPDAISSEAATTAASPAVPTGSPHPSRSPRSSHSPSPPAEPTAPTSEAPGASASSGPEASGSPAEVHPASLLVDPSTGATTAFRIADVWLPSIDGSGRFVAYWAGTVTPVFGEAGSTHAGQVVGWRGATGHLVLDGWSARLASTSTEASSAPSEEASETATEPSASSTEPTGSDAASPAPGSSQAVAEGPADTPVELAAGPLEAFDTRFDPAGTRLAVWVADPGDTTAGRLWLVVLDRASGGIGVGSQPLPAPGVRALRGFSIDTGRLGWVTPPGQDGQPSSVEVLAWAGDTFGQVQTAPGDDLQIVR